MSMYTVYKKESRYVQFYYSVYLMSSIVLLRERKATRIDYKNLHPGRPGRNMADVKSVVAEENDGFVIEEEMTPVRMRLLKSKEAVSESETDNGDSNDDDN